MEHSALDQILAVLAVDVKEFAICEFASSSAIEIPPLEQIEVHFVLAGSLHLKIGDDPIMTVPQGGIVLVPPLIRQVIGGSPAPSSMFSPSETCSRRRDGLMHYDASMGEPASVLIACGQITADFAGSFGPFDGLREPIYSLLADEPFARSAFERILLETRITSIGSKALIASLMKSCLILAIRRFAEKQGSRRALPGLFEGPSLARAVAQVMENPAANHTLVGLARSAGMSRSKFAKMFAETVGSPPMEFVARTRLDHARNLLLSTQLPVSIVANRVGFISRSHFSRAFRNTFGMDPTKMRKARDHQEVVDA
ncbi:MULTISPECIES: AraC family transcriptional regulator [Sphingomonadaceae]|uniref:helix-turn-helix domain-containing protein n=1 Tax=Sphingomonadales TaxID=204457 RepID=UPI0017A36A12|nr:MULTISPECIES: AraC family transcriptional regulator [Sphingomonadaceae]MBA4762652.1 helix-turn-helix transcriptional regulator [Sphingomonas sp.]CAH0355412.1 RCS-specific HTH-type transcriptional activator RclR [Sphingobium sp. CECT 9361]|tara:strand:- start:1395 stop:2333 length:939 start_codon:yes stop_codon:yes gene_type:complete